MMKYFKYFLFSTFLLLATFGYSQKREGSLTYEMVENATKRKQVVGSYSSYVTKDGTILKIGDKITLGVPSSNKSFAFVFVGINPTNANIAASGFEFEITKIQCDGHQNFGFFVDLITKGFMRIRYEQAVAVGEVITNVMSSDDALAELKKQKDKLDLEIISQSEYDSIKAVLIKYIK